jgi:hypothetical protein
VSGQSLVNDDLAVEPHEELPAWEVLTQLAARATAWLEAHADVIEGFHLWGSVGWACERTKLYAPVSPEAWRLITDAVESNVEIGALTDVILNAYGPGGPACTILEDEVRSAPLLQDRSVEVDEVLASCREGRNYVTICGALPLVEGLIASAYGKWQKRISDYPIEVRLDQSGALSVEEEAELLVNRSALDMVMEGIPDIWRSHPMRVGAAATDLNRHWVLHGTARGWHTRTNAVRAVLAVAAAARVAEPLLTPQS